MKSKDYCRQPIERYGDHAVQLWLADSREALAGRLETRPADLIYMDPPFATGRIFSRRIRQEGGRRPLVAGEAYHDKVTDLDAYLGFLEPVFEASQRGLSATGSLVVHVDPRTSHYVKVLLDRIFGRSQFRCEIIWGYRGGGTTRRGFPQKHDVLLWYSRGDAWTYHEERRPYHANTQSVGRHSTYAKTVEIDLERGTPVTSWWTDIPTETGWAREVDYPTAKPRALLRRVIGCLSNPGDLVVDPMLGSGTTALVARELGRQAIGIDQSPAALVTSRARLLKANIGFALYGSFETPQPAALRRESMDIVLPSTDGLEGWALGQGVPFESRLHTERQGRQAVAKRLGPVTQGDESVLLAYSDGRFGIQALPPKCDDGPRTSCQDVL